jgi:hypothetical protein
LSDTTGLKDLRDNKREVTANWATHVVESTQYHNKKFTVEHLLCGCAEAYLPRYTWQYNWHQTW